MIAVRNGHYAVVDILLLRNAKPNIQDKVSSCSYYVLESTVHALFIYIRLGGQH